MLFGIPGTRPGLAEVVTGLAPAALGPRHQRRGRRGGPQGRPAGRGPGAVVITTSSGVHAVPLAEFAILGLLALAKDLPRFVEDQRARAWPEVRRPLRELRGETLLLVGLGDIGLEVARLGKALGMRTVGFRRTEGPPPPTSTRSTAPPGRAGRPGRRHGGEPAPDRPDGRPDRPDHHRGPAPTCIFVNVGRGGVVDEPALIEALRDRRIAGAVLDVFAAEPLPPTPLWALDNVLVTPHAVALSARENERIVELFVDNLRRYLDGQPMVNVVEPGVFY